MYLKGRGCMEQKKMNELNDKMLDQMVGGDSVFDDLCNRYWQIGQILKNMKTYINQKMPPVSPLRNQIDLLLSSAQGFDGCPHPDYFATQFNAFLAMPGANDPELADDINRIRKLM